MVRRPADLIYVPLVQLVFGLTIALSVLYVLFKKYFSFNLNTISLKSWPAIVMAAVPLGASTIFLQVHDNIDTIMLGLMATPEIVGIYNAAYRIFYIFSGVFSVWLITVFPIVCKRMGEDQAKTKYFLEKIMRLSLLAMTPITVFVFLAAPLAVQILYGHEYITAVPALKILVWALIPLAISNIYGSLILLPAGLFNEFMIMVGFGALTNLLLNLILIPYFSYQGAAAATLIAQIVAAILAYYYSRKIFALSIIKLLTRPALVSISAVFSYFTVYLSMTGQDPNWQALAGAVAFIGVTGLSTLYFENDFIFSFIKEIFRK
jgi:O-antigen/teichoic acid export membrane protein